MYTLGILSVPNVRPAIACIPPTLIILVTPQSCAVYKMASATFPSLFGGVHKINSLQPAITAGTANINTVENNGAVPPGIYNPTFSIGRFSCQHSTPLSVSTKTFSVFCAL